MSLQPKEKILSLNEFKELLEAGMNGDQERLVETMMEYWGDAFLEFIIDTSVSEVKKLLAISHMLGLDFETEIWEVCRDLEEGKPLGRKFDFLTDQQTFLLRQDELSRLHTARAVMSLVWCNAMGSAAFADGLHSRVRLTSIAATRLPEADVNRAPGFLSLHPACLACSGSCI